MAAAWIKNGDPGKGARMGLCRYLQNVRRLQLAGHALLAGFSNRLLSGTHTRRAHGRAVQAVLWRLLAATVQHAADNRTSIALSITVPSNDDGFGTAITMPVFIPNWESDNWKNHDG